MTFAGINYLAVLIAAAAGWVAGAIWYMALREALDGGHRHDAGSRSRASKSQPGASLPFASARSSPAWSWPGCWPA